MAYYTWKSYKFRHDALSIFEALQDKKNCFFLDSSLKDNSSGRYSFIGCEPFFILKGNGIQALERLRALLSEHRVNLKKAFSPFLAGAVGFLSYDLGFSLEKKITQNKDDDLNIPDSFWGIYASVLIIDHLRDELYIFASGVPEKKERLGRLLAKDNFKRFEKILAKIDFTKQRAYLNQVNPHRNLRAHFTTEELRRLLKINFSAGFSERGYIDAVKKAKDYIRKGDIYQVNLSQRLESTTHDPAAQIYKRLRALSPSGFSAYFDCSDYKIISSSPEEFLRLDCERVSTRPMKGTRARCADKRLDQKLKRELIKSGKDLAELTMIVDLERNDLGKVCDYRSIRVKPLRRLEEYSTVFQTTATVEGILHKDKDRIDLIKACFPGGSITGCPKVRAMEIIEELEPHRRTIYTGSLGYLSFCGNMDLNILIRTILKKEDKAYLGVGSGIVADSKPEDEYEETLIKARAMMQALY